MMVQRGQYVLLDKKYSWWASTRLMNLHPTAFVPVPLHNRPKIERRVGMQVAHSGAPAPCHSHFFRIIFRHLWPPAAAPMPPQTAGANRSRYLESFKLGRMSDLPQVFTSSHPVAGSWFYKLSQCSRNCCARAARLCWATNFK